ncbi:S-adenosylmethionine decarboxylase [Dentipellis sp. KUC8613]|nr:S-adenosylmethionine decarboxylase [Dentipellis sp. KUC8613]
MASSADVNNSSPFEGPEKLLEIWFAPSPALVPGASSTSNGRYGLRKVDRSIWEDMLAIVKCQVLSVVQGDEIDAYLLSESSLFISPHRLILKTCGTTLNLLGLPRILDIAREHAGLPSVYRFFWSRKSYFFPERQSDLHREWKNEVEFLDGIFQNGAAYTVGKVNGDHWLLYLTNPSEDNTGSPVSPAKPLHDDSASPAPEQAAPHGLSQNIDYTIEILMTRLAPDTSSAFIFGPDSDETTPSERARALSSSIGITDLFPEHLTTLDAYAFSPCGYSSNALLKWGHAAEDEGQDEQHGGEGYYTIHVTPEEGWSYASFECNVPLPTRPSPGAQSTPDLRTLVRRVVDIFRPARLSLTLFVSSADNTEAEEEDGESAVETAQREFRAALTAAPPRAEGRPRAGVYKRTDKINYEFGGYDLAFASFDLCA